MSPLSFFRSFGCIYCAYRYTEPLFAFLSLSGLYIFYTNRWMLSGIVFSFAVWTRTSLLWFLSAPFVFLAFTLWKRCTQFFRSLLELLKNCESWSFVHVIDVLGSGFSLLATSFRSFCVMILPLLSFLIWQIEVYEFVCHSKDSPVLWLDQTDMGASDSSQSSWCTAFDRNCPQFSASFGYNIPLNTFSGWVSLFGTLFSLLFDAGRCTPYAHIQAKHWCALDCFSLFIDFSSILSPVSSLSVF